MILIADSGSTKCDWLLLQGQQTILECSTMGFNPYFHDHALITGELGKHAALTQYAAEVCFIYFYGAGCSSDELNAIVQGALQEVFPHAEVHVGHDLDGAALATHQAGTTHIACILGTGSNSCYFDGQQVHEEIPALAYILGDEGSGSYYGKRMLADFLYKRMPEHLAASFFETYQLTKDIVMEHVYMRPNANVYLASFMNFCSRHREDPYVHTLVRGGCLEFLKTHVLCFKNCREVPVNFVGSVAFHFQDILQECAAELGLKIGRVVKKPIHGLVEYHLKYTFSGVI
jgi:N-acetylglucosamine kinase-like BadF-type ATPase